MRSIPAPSPVRQGKRRLLESCAITAGLIALAYGGPAMAQVAGTGTIVTGGAGSTIVNNGGTNTTTVTVTGNQSIINWVPTDNAPDGGAIDFLPTGENLTFSGAGGYTVLNRFVNGAGGSLSRQIALNGTVNSYDTSIPVAAGAAQGGNIWFYNAGGILIGGGAAINVGSLVLTANDIDTTGGLFGPGGEIRFRGAPGSLSNVTIAQGALINTRIQGNPGGSYVAMVAPRIVQRGRVTTDGSTAYVAAEQADIRINNGLFDINVIVGAEGGDVITHTGITDGPAHQQGDVDQSRVYMVAIPKNDAVTMLVSGQVGYDDAAVAQVDPDGAVRLSAGYNIVNGEFAAAPVNAVAGNITVNDTVFRSNTVAHASGAFLGQPISQLPGPFLPAVPPPQQGRILVQGNGTFIGDTSATLNINANRAIGVTGNLIVQSPVSAAVNVDGGQLAVGGTLTIQASGLLDIVTGNRTGGLASLSVTNGGIAGVGNNVVVSAQGVGDFGADGGSGDGRGGTATITVTGAGSQLTGDSIVANANGLGGGMSGNIFTGFTVADNGGDGFGGSATINIGGGASVTATVGLGASASGQGRIGLVQSGNGRGGNASIAVSGTGVTIDTPITAVSATGLGGGSISSPTLGTFLSLNAGNGVGGTATLSFGTDSTSTIAAGATTVTASGTGGGANGANATGGDGTGGTATVEADGGGGVGFDTLVVDAAGASGGASASDGLTGTSGNAQGGSAGVVATNGSTLAVTDGLTLTATGIAAASPNVGSGSGGLVGLVASGGATIDAGSIGIDAFGGSRGNVLVTTAGAATGGDVDVIADGGTIITSDYTITAGAAVVNATGAGGAAQGGTIDLEASNGGQITARTDGVDFLDVSAQTGVSAGGGSATGGAIQLIANGGSIGLANTTLTAGGISGGATTPGSANPLGLGGTILVQVSDDLNGSGAMSFIGLNASADGRTAVNVEGAPGLPFDTAGNGRGGNVGIDVQGGTLDAGSITLSADGYGGGSGASSASGRGGTAGFTQSDGIATIAGDLTVHANGFGGVAQGVSGRGTGGTATIDLTGGTISAARLIAQANGTGGAGNSGDDVDPANIVPGGTGGIGQGGDATITIDGTAVVNASSIAAYSGGQGGTGGDFFNQFSFSGDPGPTGTGGNGTGGNATVNLDGGTLNATSVVADASGIGGDGGNSFFSSSSGGATGLGVGGNGGRGQGGIATIALSLPVGPSTSLASISHGVGGDGGFHNVGGRGGDGFGGTAQAVVTGFDAGALAVTLDSAATGGTGADGRDGAGGQGGDAVGGMSRITADGTDAAVALGQVDFITGGTGGNGGSGSLGFGAFTPESPTGGNGGFGQGGTIEIVANEGGTVTLAAAAGGPLTLSSGGTGGDGGRGADNFYSTTQPGPDGMLGTADDIVVNAFGGNGGIAGGGTGGTVHLVANGGTITSGGSALDIRVNGVSGNGGDGGNGSGGDGSCCTGFADQGGLVRIEAFAGSSGPGQIDLGDTTINADGFTAGRIEIISGGTITMASLSASALGFANPTNSDTDLASQGIFLGIYGGTISTAGDMTLTTDGSVGAYAQSTGQVDIGGDLVITAGDQVDIRHDFREGNAPTIVSGGSMSFTAANTIRSAPGSLVSAGTSLVMNATGPNSAIDVDSLSAQTLTLLLAQNGRINVYGTSTSGDDLTASASGEVAINQAIAGDDISLTGGTLVVGRLATNATGLDSEIDGSNIFMRSTGAATVDHAEADNDFTADVGSFSTGLNSIITGGDIFITSAGAVDLGNSTAGGSVSVGGQSIDFNTITASLSVSLTATGNTPGAQGVTGGSIDANGDINLNGAGVAIDGALTSRNGSIYANASTGSVAISQVNADDNTAITAAGDITGTYNGLTGVSLTAGGDIDATATATGFQSSSSGPPTAASVFVDAGGDVRLTSGNASGMYGINAGGAVSLNGVSAGQDMLILAGTTANLTNLTAGDDLTVQAGGTITASGLLTTGAGTDAETLSYGGNASSGFGFQINGSVANGSNILLGSTTGNIGLTTANAFNDLTATATTGAVSSTGFLQSGRNTQVTAARVNVAAITAGNDILITTTAGGVSASGALAAGHDVTIGAAGAVNLSELDAGDDVRVDAGGAATVGAAYAYGTGADNDGDGSNVVLSAGGAMQITGFAQAPNRIDLQGTSVSIAGFDAGGDANFTATGAGITTGGGHAGGNLAFDAASTIDSGALTVDGFGRLTAAGAVTLTGDVAARGLRVEGAEIALGGVNASNGDIVLVANDGGISANGAIDSNGGFTAFATDTIALSGDVTSANTVQIFGGAIALASLSGGSGIQLTATDGSITSTGTISAGSDIFVSTAGGGTFNRLLAGDDIAMLGTGDVTVAFMNATGDNPQGEEVGSNIRFDIVGDVHIDHAEAADDFVANVTSLSTGLNSIITGGNVEINATDAVDLGNTTAGGHVGVNGQSILFNTIDAGDYVALDATGSAPTSGPISGQTIIAGGDILIQAASIDIASITGAGALNAATNGGNVAIDDADLDGNITIAAAANLTGNYSAGGDMRLNADGNVTVTANAAGGFPDPQNGDAPTAGNIFIDSGGNVALANSNAAGDFGVNGRAVTLTNVTAGEDMLVLARTTANLTGISAGDDLDVVAAGAITATGASATGDGPDGLTLSYSSANGFTIGQGEGVSSTDGADIDLRSTGSSVTASNLSAGDDIVLRAATTLAVNGATTRGIGQTDGASNIETQSGDATLAGLNAFTDLAVTSTGAVEVTGTARAGRDVAITAVSLDLATLVNPAGNFVDTLTAGRDLTVDTTGAISGGAVAARNDATLTAGTTIALTRVSTGNNGDVELEAADGIAVDGIFSQGATSLDSSDGAIIVNTLSSRGAVNANGDSVAITGSGDLVFAGLAADVGDATVRTDGDLTVANGDVAGLATFGSGNGRLTIASLTAANTRLESFGDMALTNVSVDGDISVYSQSALRIDGVVTGESIGLASTDIAIGANARVGTAGVTGSLQIANIDNSRQTFIGGDGSGDGYNIDASELTRVYGSDIVIRAPVVDRSGERFIGTVPPDVVIDDFTMTAGSATSNLGANGSLTIDTQGTARVIGDVALTGMADANAFNILADRSLEIILGDGSIRLTGTSDTTPGGQLNLASEDVIVATLAAIDDVADATTTDAIEARLAQNDGVTSDDGALYAGGINVGVFGGFYVQNSGGGTDYGQRRGLTFGAGGLNVNTEGSETRIVLNGVHLGPNGQVTGLDAIPLLTINGAPASPTAADFDARSTFNGCLIANTGACTVIPTPEYEPSFPVQDVIDDQDDNDGTDGTGITLPTALITMRDLDPLSGEPLLDDPVTGAGNDDLWTPTLDACDPASTPGGSCPAAK